MNKSFAALRFRRIIRESAVVVKRSMERRQDKSTQGFTLMEMLTVLAIMAIVGAMVGPAMQSLAGAGTINKSVSDLGETIENARAYAMAHHTYVRVIFSQVPVSASQLTPKVIVLAISPATGGLDQNDVASMGDPAKWPSIGRPLILSNLVINNGLNATSPDTNSYSDPSQSNMVSSSVGVVRQIGDLSPTPTFTSCIQLAPSGQAEIIDRTPARYIKMGFDRPSPRNGKDPFLLRISGINGNIDILRKENGIQ